jgi:hypothetical protein
MSTDTGGPAFPCVNDEGLDIAGMSLRDYFAAKAMDAICSALSQGMHPHDVSKMAADAYFIADAMIKARQE